MDIHEVKKLISEVMQREIKKSIQTPAQNAITRLVRQANPDKLKKVADLFGYTGDPHSIEDMSAFVEDGLKDADPSTIDFIYKTISKKTIDELIGKFKENQQVSFFDERSKKIETGKIERIVKSNTGDQYKLNVKGNSVWKLENEIGTPEDIARKYSEQTGIKKSPEERRSALKMQFDRPEESIDFESIVKEEVKKFLSEKGIL